MFERCTAASAPNGLGLLSHAAIIAVGSWSSLGRRQVVKNDNVHKQRRLEPVGRTPRHRPVVAVGCGSGSDGRNRHLTATKPIVASGDHTPATDPAIRVVVLTLLAVDGVLSAVTAALLLPAYIGSVPFPISALISGLVNAALVWAAMRWTTSLRMAALPLWTWLLTVALTSLGGPGNDIIFDGPGILGYRALLLIGLGIVPPAGVLWRRRDVLGSLHSASHD